MKVLNRILTIVSLLVLLVIQPNCAHAPKHQTAPLLSEEQKAQLGTMGVVTANFQPEFTFREPMPKGQAAATGAMAGFAGCVLGGLYSGNPLGAAAGVVISPVGALVGGVYGTIEGVTESKKKETASALNEVVMDFKIQEMMRDRFLAVARDKTTYPFILLDEKGPTVPDDEVNYHPISDKGVDTVVEISVLRYGLWAEPGMNPPLSLFMTVTTKLKRVSDGVVVCNHTFRYEGLEKLKFTKWALDHGKPLRDGMDRSFESLSKEMVEKVFSPGKSSRVEP